MSPKNKYLIGPLVLDCNRGDQALVWEAIRLIRRADPEAEIAIMADDYEDPQSSQSKQTRAKGIQILPSILPNPRRSASKNKVEVHDTGISLLKMKIRALLDYLQMQVLLLFPRSSFVAKWMLGAERFKTYSYMKGCKALVIKGGGFIYAHPGIRWFYFIWFGLFSLIIAHKLGIKTIILPNSFGPFENPHGKTLARQVLGKCDMVAVRERLSFDTLQDMLPGKPKQFPDMAFHLPMADKEWARSELEKRKIPLNQPCVGLTMRPWRFPDADNPNERYENYIDSHVAFVKYLFEKGYNVVLFAHVVGPHAHEDDRIALHALMDRLGDNNSLFYIDGDYDCCQMKAFYGFMDLMTCTRFHSAIFSLSQKVPCLAISYQGHKTTGIMADLGLEEYVIGINDVNEDTLVTRFDKLKLHAHTIAEELKTRIEEIHHALATLDRRYQETVHAAPKVSA